MINLLFSLIQEARRQIRWPVVGGCFVLVLTIGALGFALDGWAYDCVRNAGNGPWEIAAERLSFWGDFLPGTVPLSVGIWLLGIWCKRPRWQQAAVACLLSAVVAGSLVSAVRLTVGRTRPDATLETARARLGYEPKPIISLGHLLPDGQMMDGFYGIKRPAMFQAFPSGHSATSVATAATLVVTLPECGVVLVPVAAGVCWSRLYLHKHHLSDVLVGALVGLIVGIFCGRVTLRLR